MVLITASRNQSRPVAVVLVQVLPNSSLSPAAKAEEEVASVLLTSAVFLSMLVWCYQRIRFRIPKLVLNALLSRR